MIGINISELEKRIEQLLHDWQVVGGAVGIVKDDEIVSLRGYGKKQADKDDPVDENTIFGIGSNSKSFTAAAAALLVDEGKLSFDAPIIKTLPDFKLADTWITEHITLRDMLSHRSGLGRSMRILYNRSFDLPEVVRRLRFFPFESEFRDAFGYNNYHFMVAGRMIEVISGQSWPDFMRERIFLPLGMHASSADLSQLNGQVNISAAHDDLSDSLLPHYARLFSQQQVIPWADVGNQPAGGINASASDLTRWMRMLLNEGKHEGRQFLSPQVIAQMTSPVSTFNNPLNSDLGFLPMLGADINFFTYGLGWFIIDYKGRKMYFHGGQIHGFNSIVAFFPQERLSFCILTNAHHTYAHAALTFTIADAFLGGERRDWHNDMLGLARAMLQGEQAKVEQINAQRKTGTRPALELQAYCGTFENDFAGETQVELQQNTLWMRYGTAFYGELLHWENEAFYCRWEDRTFDYNRIIFHLSEDRQVIGLTVEGEGYYRRTG